MECMTQRLSIFSESTRNAATSTTVMHRDSISGIKQARPSGSGMRAISTSLARSCVQRNRANAASLIQRSDLLRNVPSPISASCKSRILPLGSWSLLSTQSPSTNKPDDPAISLIAICIQPAGRPSIGLVKNFLQFPPEGPLNPSSHRSTHPSPAAPAPRAPADQPRSRRCRPSARRYRGCRLSPARSARA